jgi:arylsulfatase A-like enzyme
MSGMYPSRNGVFANCMKGSPDGMRDDAICITDVLADSGYETALVGKAHWERTLPLFDADGNYAGTQRPPGGHYVNPFDTYVPPGAGRHSNKLWFQTIRDVHYDPLVYSSAPALAGGKRDGEVYHAKGFSSVIEADVAIDYLRNKNGERDPQKPFSLIWNTVPPHTPYSSLKDCEEDIYSKYYKDMPLRELLVRPNIDVPKAGREGNLELSARIYFSLVSSVDRQVGRVLQALEQSGEADNTIVIFTSDHGEMMGSHGLFAKSVIYDESFLIPLMIRFPKKLRPRTEDLMIGRVDLMPTILGLAGLESKIPHSVQGVDYSGGLLSQRFATHKRPKSAVYLMENGRGVRTDRYTYCVGKDGSTQLYDNTNDPYQQKNLPLNAVDSSDLRGLQEELGRWLRDATDSWYEDRSHSDLISYPAGLEHPSKDQDCSGASAPRNPLNLIGFPGTAKAPAEVGS